jgi:fucose permease
VTPAAPAAVPSGGSASPPGRRSLERARVAVAVVFAVNGLAFASWIARLPAVRDGLGLTPAQLGLLLLCGSGGAFVALPTAGPLVQRFTAARVVVGGGVVVAAGLAAVAASTTTGIVPLAALGLLATGLGIATWDVAMNVEGAAVEHRLGRTLMPRLHAGFSVGTVAGALLGAGAAAIGLPVSAQLLATAAVVLVTLAVAVRAFLPVAAEDTRAQQARGFGVRQAWREPRTLLVGLFTLAFALTEGIANDWLALALTDGHGTSDAVGALGFGAFVTAMTLARTFGGALLERYGRAAVLRALGALAAAGLLLVVAGPSLGWVVAGALLWGVGASLGFPVGMSAAADDPERAAVRVSVVSSVAYTAFLAGPPVIGFLAESFGVLRALLVVLGALAVGIAAAGATRPLRPAGAPAPAPAAL